MPPRSGTRKPEPWEYGEEVNTYHGDYIVSSRSPSPPAEDDDEKARRALRQRLNQIKK